MFDDLIHGFTVGISHFTDTAGSIVSGVSQGAWNMVENIFNILIRLILNLLDSITSPFGFKFSEFLSTLSSFIKGNFNLINDVVSIFPSPFNEIFIFSLIFTICVLIYKFIRG